MFEKLENMCRKTWKSSPKLLDLYQNLEASRRMTSLPPTMTWAAEQSVVRPRRQLPKVPEGSAAATQRAHRLVSDHGDTFDVGLGVLLATRSSLFVNLHDGL